MRYWLRRQSDRLCSRGAVRVAKCDSADDLPRFLQALYSLHRARWHERGGCGVFEDDRRRAFYERMCRAMLQAGMLDFWLLEVDNSPVAAEIGLRCGDTYTSLQSGFAPAFRQESPGVVLMGRIVGELIGDGVRYYDLVGGDELYKQRWGADRGWYVNLRCARPQSRGAAYLRFADLYVRGRNWGERHIPAPLWTRLRRAYHRLQGF
jgi:CelD/BcsL family acetyltransferase involved in cellulose biosynthesis